MPKLLIIRQYIFLLFSVDISEKRKHVHVEIRKGKRRKLAKFWLEPQIELFEKGNLNKKELAEANYLIIENRDLLISQIERFFKGQKIKTINK